MRFVWRRATLELAVMVVAERRCREAHVAALAAGQRVVHLIAFVMRIMVSS